MSVQTAIRLDQAIRDVMDKARRKAMVQWLDMGYGHLEEQVEFLDEIMERLKVIQDGA